MCSAVTLYLDPKTVDESSPGFILHRLARYKLMAVDPTPGWDVLQGACIGGDHLQGGADRHPANLVLGSDDGQGAQ